MKPKWLKFTNELSSPEAVIEIFSRIGGSEDDDDLGISAQFFNWMMKDVPAERNLRVRINCPGGNLFQGLAIYNMLSARKDKVTCEVVGLAASIGSVIACAGSKLVMPENAMMMIHEVSGEAFGTAPDLIKTAELIEKNNEIIAGIYAAKCGSTPEKMRAMMKEETWLTGKECKAMGLCDELTDASNLENSISDFDFSKCRNVPASLVNAQKTSAVQAQNKRNEMKDKLIALLAQHGVKMAAESTEEQLFAELNKITAKDTAKDAIASLKAEIDKLTAERETARKDSIRAKLTACVTEGRIPVDSLENWTAAAMKDETIVAALQRLPAQTPGSAPSVVIVNEDIRNIESELKRKTGAARGVLFNEHKARIIPYLTNTNTVSGDLQRIAIMDAAVREFARVIAPLTAFSTVFRDVVLEGSDTVSVPFFPNISAASTAWNASNGYVAGNSTINAIKVTVNKRPYQAFSFTSSELARQPYLSMQRLAVQQAEKLGLDVFQDVLTAITLADFGAAAVTVASANFGWNELVDVKTACDDANWAQTGRTLMLLPSYYNAIVKDTRTTAYALGSATVTSEGTLPPLAGFRNIYQSPNIPTNSESLVGMAILPQALAIAFSPVKPSQAVSQQLLTYEMATDPASGATLEYRMWGDPQKDQTFSVFEANYGYVKGDTAAAKRICTT